MDYQKLDAILKEMKDFPVDRIQIYLQSKTDVGAHEKLEDCDCESTGCHPNCSCHEVIY